MVIDGDNWVNDNLPYELIINEEYVERDQVVSYSSINAINSLIYGNGGVKIWPTELLANSSSHEFACSSQSNNTDFLYNPSIKYLQRNLIASSTVQNCSKQQAFTAGYREGVKLTSTKSIEPMARFYLNTWCSIGADVEFGEWAIYGARLGVHDSLFKSTFVTSSINDLDSLYALVNRFQTIDELKTFVNSILDYARLKSVYGISAVDMNKSKSSALKWLIKRVPRTTQEDAIWKNKMYGVEQ